MLKIYFSIRISHLLKGIVNMVILSVHSPIPFNVDFKCHLQEMYANEYIFLLRREKFQASQAHFTLLLGSKTLGILGWVKFMTIKHLVVSKFCYHHCQFFHV